MWSTWWPPTRALPWHFGSIGVSIAIGFFAGSPIVAAQANRPASSPLYCKSSEQLPLEGLVSGAADRRLGLVIAGRVIELNLAATQEGADSRGTTVQMPPVSRLARFDLVDLKESGRPLREVFIYPEDWLKAEGVELPEEPPSLQVESDAPTWMTRWLSVVGLTFRSDAGRFVPSLDGAGLIRVSGSIANLGLTEESKEVEPLDEEWFLILLGAKGARRVELEPEGLGRTLREMSEERWLDPLNLLVASRPLDVVVNRLPVARSVSGEPVIEVIRAQAGTAVVSYADWTRSLGRDPRADRMLVALLTEPAVEWDPFDAEVFVTGDEERIDSDPVLSAIVNRVDHPEGADLLLVDVRGKAEVQSRELERVARLAATGGAKILLLGRSDAAEQALGLDEGLLDESTPGPVVKPHATWIPHDSFPSGHQSRWEQMWILTEIGVSLIPEEKSK